LNPNDIDEEGRQKAEATLMEAIDEAEELGAKGIAFLSGKWKPETKAQAYAQLLKTTRNLCDYAAGKGMQVVIEVFDFDIAKAALLGPAPYAAQFAAEMRTTHNNFGLMIDLSHIPMCRETSQFVVRTLRPYLVHFHIGNTVCGDKSAEGYGDEHQRFGFPNSANDTAQVLTFLRVLKEEGFFDAAEPYTLSFEVKPWKDEDADAVVANAKRVLNRAWALLED
ncbi:MAG: TIM barrel protein, partial [Oscillospiraceae bacterium]